MSKKKKYEGSVDKLVDKVKCIGADIVSIEKGDNKQVVRTGGGVVINWWKSTGTINFQGCLEARNELMERFWSDAV